MTNNSWHQPGQPFGDGTGGQYQNLKPQGHPPPSCFFCSGPHYVVNCPNRQGQVPQPGPSAIGYPSSAPQGGQWTNGQSGARINSYGPPQSSMIPQYTPPSQPHQYSSGHGSYGPSQTPPYQQYGNAQNPYGPPIAAAPYQQYGSAPPTNYPARPSFRHNKFRTHHIVNQVHNSPNAYIPPLGPYHGTTGPSPSFGSQWSPNKSPPSHGSSLYSKNQTDGNGIKREFSATPRVQTQTPQHSPVNERRSSSYQQGSTSTASHQGQSQQGLAGIGPAFNADNNSTPITGDNLQKDEIEVKPESRRSSNASSRASTPFRRYGYESISTDPSKPMYNNGSGASSEIVENHEIGFVSLKEEGELSDDDSKQQEFNWEFKKIFKDPAPFEYVALAQPLSATFSEKATPVPLLYVNQRDKSVSRYARVDNLEEFTRPIRSQSQWSYLQEDPGFQEVNQDGPLIPLDEVPTWLAERHGVPIPKSRKRDRSTSLHQDSNGQLYGETTIERANDDQPHKRVKVEDDVNEDTILVEVPEVVPLAPGTPTVALVGGTVADENDVWAPQPGEGAEAAKIDSTEAKLASLGVTGSPKPVRRPSSISAHGSGEGFSGRESVPYSMSPAESVQDKPECSNSPQGHNFLVQGSHAGAKPPVQPKSPNSPSHVSAPYAPQNQYHNSYPPQLNLPQQLQGPAQNQNYPQQGSQQPGPPQAQYVNGYPVQNQYPNGAPSQQQPPFMGPQHRQSPYGNTISPQSHGPYLNQQFGFPQQNGYSNGAPSQGMPPYGTAFPVQQSPQQTFYGNDMHMLPNTPHGMLPQVHDQYNGAAYVSGPQGQYESGPQGQGSYSGQSQSYYNNGGYPQNHAQYRPSGPAPASLNSLQYGPSANAYGNPDPGIAHQGNQQYAPQPNGVLVQGQYSNGAPPNQPPRQDSGYVSARGSYSNGADSGSEANSLNPRQNNQHPTQQKVEANNSDKPKSSHEAQVQLDDAHGTGDYGSDEDRALSPISRELLGVSNPELSPVSREILGKLNTGPKKKPEPMRQPDDGGTMKRPKPKRLPPEVATAYSRRW
ncbi:hypothetical protein B0O99DRAFT_123014 [Bisporella sp. PMI_857]|nr:hypothetical protein B0O99DRAFT_123014 [Bisporella sp. PMI_857]